MQVLKTLVICGQEIRVIVASPKEVPALSDKYGLSDFDAGAIYLHEENTPSRMRSVLVHEVLHVFLEASGLGQFFAGHLAKGKDFDALEETAIRLATPHVVALLSDNGELWTVGDGDADDLS
jgi:Zn-dependent peptidase ImmA (M78 family)